jgi:hypothetical protein
MKKIKKTFLYIFGSFMAFAFNQTGMSAQMQTLYGIEPMPEYGIGFISEPTLWERILSVILSPIVMVIIIVLAIIIGTVIFIKRSRKNAKKNS